MCSCLAQEPDKIIYIGRNARQMEEFIARCRTIFRSEIVFECRKADFQNLDNLTELLTGIVETEPACAFDLTGGPDLALVAMGIVAERCREKHIQMHRFSISGGNALDCDGDGVTLTPERTVSLTVDQLIALHGGILARERMEEPWRLDEALLTAIPLLWSEVRKNPGFWNLNSNFLARVNSLQEEAGSTDRRVVVPFESFPNPDTLGDSADKVRPLLRILKEAGLVTDFSVSSSPIVIEYADPQIRRILSKAGNILELKTYAAAVQAKGKKGEPVYSGVVNGAIIDWDGVQPAEGVDPINEIDLILIRGLQPVFISCKNGMFGAEELYKFNAVASRFGGKYAKKVLLSTQPVDAHDLILRAKELGIRLVDNLAAMTDTRFGKTVATLYTM